MRYVKCVVLSVLFFLIPIVAFAGDLDDPAAPTSADSAMYTLDDIYNRLDSNTQATKRSSGFTEPVDAPNPTGHTLDQVYGKAIPTQVAKTGQDTCYDADGCVTSCSDTGQDGESQMGVPRPDPRFSDNEDGTVTDNLTGLIWLKDPSCLGSSIWEDALTACNDLKDPACGLSDGSNLGDWRLPNASELRSLITLSTVSGLPETPFVNLEGFYWSSTSTMCMESDPDKDKESCAFYLLCLSKVLANNYTKDTSLGVWPVRGGGQ